MPLNLKQARVLAYTEHMKTPWVNLISLTVKQTGPTGSQQHTSQKKAENENITNVTRYPTCTGWSNNRKQNSLPFIATVKISVQKAAAFQNNSIASSTNSLIRSVLSAFICTIVLRTPAYHLGAKSTIMILTSPAKDVVVVSKLQITHKRSYIVVMDVTLQVACKEINLRIARTSPASWYKCLQFQSIYH